MFFETLDQEIIGHSFVIMIKRFTKIFSFQKLSSTSIDERARRHKGQPRLSEYFHRKPVIVKDGIVEGVLAIRQAIQLSVLRLERSLLVSYRFVLVEG